MTWITLDEHPCSINDAFFVTTHTDNHWDDIPASFHNGACGFSFADGHAEIHKWLSGASKYPNPAVLRYQYPAQINFDAAGRADLAWYVERLQLIPFK